MAANKRTLVKPELRIIQKSSNGYSLNLPVNLCRELGIQGKETVKCTLVDNKLVIEVINY